MTGPVNCRGEGGGHRRGVAEDNGEGIRRAREEGDQGDSEHREDGGAMAVPAGTLPLVLLLHVPGGHSVFVLLRDARLRRCGGASVLPHSGRVLGGRGVR